jgi:hypothetical protein
MELEQRMKARWHSINSRMYALAVYRFPCMYVLAVYRWGHRVRWRTWDGEPAADARIGRVIFRSIEYWTVQLWDPYVSTAVGPDVRFVSSSNEVQSSLIQFIWGPKSMDFRNPVPERGTYSCFPLFLHIITMFHFQFSNLRAFYFWSGNLKKLLTKVNLLIRTQQSCILGVMAVVLKIGAGRTASTGHYCSQGAPFTTASSWCWSRSLILTKVTNLDTLKQYR